MKLSTRILLTAWLAAFAGRAGAATLDIRGRLTDSQGRPESGTCLLRFKLFDLQQPQSPAWSDSIYVSVKAGQFRAQLGKTRAIPARLFTEGYRLAVEAPAGTGWKAEATSASAPAATVAKTAPEPSSEPAQVPEADGKAGEIQRLKAGLAKRPAAPAPPPVGEPEALRTSFNRTSPRPAAFLKPRPQVAKAPEPAAEPVEDDRIQGQIDRARSEAAQSKREAELLKARLEAIERKMKPSGASRSSRIYEVQSGDTLQSVAAKVFGDPARWPELYHANADRIQRGGDLSPGQKLVIPGGAP